MIKLQFTHKDLEDIEGYDDANAPWEYAEGGDELEDNLVDARHDIEFFICKLDLTSSAQALSSEYDGDLIQIYQEIRIGEKQYSVLIYEYNIEEMAAFNSILSLCNDVAYRTDEFNKNVLMINNLSSLFSSSSVTHTEKYII